MADIELVIKIPKEDFEIMKHNIAVNNPLCPLSEKEMVVTIANSTPLSKGHGRLVDMSEVLIKLMQFYDGDKSIGQCLDEVNTIIEADKAESEGDDI